MDHQLLSLGLNIVIAVLLCTTIVYAYMLNKRLQALRNDKEEMENLARKFYDATNRAEASIKALKQSSIDLNKDIQGTIEKARILRDELTFILERGDLLASQLEGSISEKRPEKGAGPDLAQLLQKAVESSEKDKKNKDLQNLQDIFQTDADTRSAAEKELLKALKGVR